MKKKILTLVLVLMLALGVGLVLAACNSGDNDNNGTKQAVAPKGVKGITTGKQESGGVTFTNYRVGITNEIDWNTMSKDEKQKIINYVFDEVIKQNSENNIKYFNILGVHDSGEVLFAFDRETNEIVTYKGGQNEFRFAMPNK